MYSLEDCRLFSCRNLTGKKIKSRKVKKGLLCGFSVKQSA